MNEGIILEGKELVKSGNQYFFSIGKKLVDTGVVRREKTYKLTIEEVDSQND